MEVFQSFFKSEIITLAISLIGCFTGISGLLISLYSLFRERFRLKIIFADTENWFFPKLNEYDSYRTNLQAIVRFNLINRSTQPISVYDLEVKLNNKPLRYEQYPNDSLRLLNLYETAFPNRKEYRNIPMDRQHHFPIRLNAHETYEAFLFIAYFPDVENVAQKLSFTFKTTKRTVRTTCKILPLFPHEASLPDEIPW